MLERFLSHRHALPLMGIIFVFLILSGCGKPTPLPIPLSFSLTAENLAVAVDTKSQIDAIARLEDGSNMDFSSYVDWQSSDKTIASVDKGKINAIAPGQTTISASYNDETHSLLLTVVDAELQLIQVSNNNLRLAKGLQKQYTVTGLFSNGHKQDLTSLATWKTIPDGIASISKEGLVTTVNPGQVAITALINNSLATALLTVTDATLSSIHVRTLRTSLPQQVSQAFTAIGFFSDGSQQDLSKDVSWTSNDPAIADFETNNEMNTKATGSVTVTASLGDIKGELNVTVVDQALSELFFRPVKNPIPLGIGVSLRVYGQFSSDTIIDLTDQVTWSNDNSASFFLDEQQNIGKVVALTSGSAKITASLGAVSTSTTLTSSDASLEEISISPTQIKLPTDYQRQLTAIGFYSDGSSFGITKQASWYSSAPTIVETDNAFSGIVKSVASGKAVIFSALGDQISGREIDVTDLDIASNTTAISISNVEEKLPVGFSLYMSAIGVDIDGYGYYATQFVDWGINDNSLAIFSSFDNEEGLLTATSPGNATVSAKLGELSVEKTITITDAKLVSIEIQNDSTIFPIGQQTRFRAIASFDDNSTLDISDQVVWSVAEKENLFIYPESGLAIPLAAGTATVKASKGDITGSLAIITNDAKLTGIAINAAATSIIVKASLPLQAVGTYDDGSTRDITSLVYWQTANAISPDKASPAIIDNGEKAGTIYGGNNSGSVEITATLNEQTSSITLPIVTSAP